ncbi:MAG: LPS-assembly protein LptD [Gammaproteobacteria bacterium]
MSLIRYPTALFFALLAVAPAHAREPSPEDLWAVCPNDAYIPSQPTADDPLEAGATQVTAEEGEFAEQGTSSFTGGVTVVRQGQSLVADRMTYDDATRRAHFIGSARFWTDSLYWEGAEGEVRFDTEFGELLDGRYQLIGRRGRGKAGMIGIDFANDRSELETVDYTTCPGREPAWRFAARRMNLDRERDIGSARHATIRVGNVPVLYLPYLTFPLSDKRKSGFLAPVFGNKTASGADIAIPYYWNIAPEYDATFTPRILGDRGIMLGGQFRYLLDNGEGTAELEVLPQDSGYEDRTRALVKIEHAQGFLDGNASAYVLYNDVTDNRYFEDFGNSLSVTSTRYLEQRGDLNYWGRFWYGRMRVLRYQSVDRSLAAFGPYTRLPEFYVTTYFPERNWRPAFNTVANLTYFDREAGTVGARMELRPAVSLPVRTPGYFFVPKLELRYAQYWLEGNTVGGNSISRAIPAASLDTGLDLERDLHFAGVRMVQTLEPHAYYLYIPKVSQNDVPVFDTGLYDFSFSQLFRDDRFGGGDRVGDTNQVSVGVQSRIIDSTTGFERLRAGIGQIYYFADREVVVPGGLPQTADTSEIVAEATARLTREWSVGGALQWDPAAEQTRKGALRLRYRDGEGAIVNFDYRLRRAITDVAQTDLSIRWPVTENWGLMGRWNYSLEDESTLEVVGGVEYNSCCWGVRAAVRRFLRTADGTFNTGFFVQIEFKGLAGIGRQTQTFFSKTVPGYEPDF